MGLYSHRTLHTAHITDDVFYCAEPFSIFETKIEPLVKQVLDSSCYISSKDELNIFKHSHTSQCNGYQLSPLKKVYTKCKKNDNYLCHYNVKDKDQRAEQTDRMTFSTLVMSRAKLWGWCECVLSVILHVGLLHMCAFTYMCEDVNCRTITAGVYEFVNSDIGRFYIHH